MEKRNPAARNNSIIPAVADQQIEITFYTDPLCCWSWAFQPQLDQLEASLGDQVRWVLKMGGMIPDWAHYQDVFNSITRPAQMAPIWMHAGRIAGVPIAHDLWLRDPPVSSYPSCVSVKCAQLQSEQLGREMLLELKSACMGAGLNIAKKEVLMEIAHRLATKNNLFDAHLFRSDFERGNGQKDFGDDLNLIRKYGITRFPSLAIKAFTKTILISGYRDAASLFNSIQTVAPSIANYTT